MDDALTEEQAFAIATTWREQLRGCVRLETEVPPLQAQSIFETIEWVSVNLDSRSSGQLARRKAAYARATTIAWTALSCCKGFSGSENPQFWLRILRRWDDATLRFTDPPADPNAPTQRPPLQNVRFFPSVKEKAFPRIKLKPGYQTHGDCERIFLGLASLPDATRDVQLHAILTQLAPLVRRWYWACHIAVSVDVAEGTEIARVLTENHAAEPEDDELALMSCLGKPSMQVTTIVADRFSSAQALAVLEAELSLDEVNVTRTAELHQIVLDHQLFPVLLRRPHQHFNRADQLSQWTVSRARFTLGSDPHIAKICSALPHVQTIQCLEVAAAHGEGLVSASDWAWLGYALFHPDADSRSGLSSLHIDVHGASAEDFDAFQRMAIGNNLSADMKDETLSFQYVEGYVGDEGAQVWSLPGVQRRILQSTLTMTWVTLCIPSLEAIDLDQEWIRVVNPGFGFGQLRTEFLEDLRSRPPGKPSIRSLRIGGVWTSVSSRVAREPQQLQDQRVKILLNRLGEGLTALDWRDSQHVSIAAMRDLRRFCPSLKSLRISHNGAVWADSGGKQIWPQLQELELDTATTYNRASRELQPLQADCLPNLEALKINAEPSTFASCQDALLAFITDQITLLFLSWSHCATAERTSTVTEVAAKRALEEEIKKLAVDVVKPPLQLARRLAFLSAINVTPLSALGQSCSDIGALIFSFEPKVLRREIYIDL